MGIAFEDRIIINSILENLIICTLGLYIIPRMYKYLKQLIADRE